jgi:Trp operon repressor
MLFRLFTSATNDNEMEQLLEFTFTESERNKIIERWRIFDACDQGYTQREIAKMVPCSIVTATRGAKIYKKHKETIQKLLVKFREDGF